MNSIAVKCPHCQRSVRAGVNLNGRLIKCPNCTSDILLPYSPSILSQQGVFEITGMKSRVSQQIEPSFDPPLQSVAENAQERIKLMVENKEKKIKDPFKVKIEYFPEGTGDHPWRARIFGEGMATLSITPGSLQDFKASAPRIVEKVEKWLDDTQPEWRNLSRRFYIPWVRNNIIPERAYRRDGWVLVEENLHSGSTHVRLQVTDKHNATIQHYFENAEPLEIQKGDVFYAYVYVDEKDPPSQLMLQFNDGNWDHRAWWGEPNITFGKNSAIVPEYYPMGKFPPAGRWFRLEVPPALVGFKVGSKINGMAFTQAGGRAYWGHAGISR